MRYYEYNGEVYSQTQMAKMAGLSIGGFRKRIQAGWNIEEIMTTPPYKYGRQANLGMNSKPSLPKENKPPKD